MRQGIADFYAANQTPLSSLVTAGAKRNLTETAVLTAAEALYDEIQAGLEVRPIRLSWEVFTRAKSMEAEVNQTAIDQHADLQKVIDALWILIEWYRKPWWERIFKRPQYD